MGRLSLVALLYTPYLTRITATGPRKTWQSGERCNQVEKCPCDDYGVVDVNQHHDDLTKTVLTMLEVCLNC